MNAQDVVVAPAESNFLDRIGIPSELFWGFVGVLLFLTGDGVESGFLAPYLSELHFTEKSVGAIFTFYGFMAALAGWLSGALSEVWGPRRVIAIGLAIWMVFQTIFLTLGVSTHNYRSIFFAYGLRGLGYPLFAYGFLVWITVAAPKHRLASAMGWFWFAFTGGLPTLGSVVARYTIPRIGMYNTMWLATGIVLLGGAVLLVGVRDRRGSQRLAASNENPVAALVGSLKLAYQQPKTLIACIVRMINTAPEFGFFLILPAFFQRTIGFTQSQYLALLSAIFFSNIIWNLLFGLIGDRFGWRRTVAICGGFGCTITTLALYYVPLATRSYHWSVVVGMLYGATLAGYVPLSALTPMLAPDRRGEALSLLSLGASASMLVGPAIVTLLMGSIGLIGVMWVFAGLYLISGVMALTLRNNTDTMAGA
jgi:polyol permease family